MLRAAADSDSKSFEYLFAAWFVFTTLMIAGFASVGDAAVTPSPEMEHPMGLSPASPSPSATEPPSVVYGGLTWSVLEARQVFRENTAEGRPIVIVETVVANAADGVVQRVRDSDLAIVWPDGRRDEVHRFEQLRGVTSFSLTPGEVRELTLVFKPRTNNDPDLTTLTFEIAEAGREPAVLPLIGPAQPPRHPREITFSEPPTAVTVTPDHPGGLMVGPRWAVLDVNAGPYRAAAGEQLVLVDVLVEVLSLIHI